MARDLVSPTKAIAFGAVLGVLATLILGLGANWLSAGLALVANLYYVFVYTMALKRRTSQNIVWGGIAGCFPPLIGWTAVTGQVAWVPLVLFAIVFAWTPPHTWALALRYREDYQNAHIPMLPVVAPPVAVAWRILAYSVLTVAVSLLLWPVAGTGWLYPVVALVAGLAMLAEAVALLVRARRGLEQLPRDRVHRCCDRPASVLIPGVCAPGARVSHQRLARVAVNRAVPTMWSVTSHGGRARKYWA
jgi:protoheme IX farnesyltransferase